MRVSQFWRDTLDEAGLATILPILGLPTQSGTPYYVDSVTGSSANSGLSWDLPKATIAQAVALCTAANGDVVHVAAGHTETISGAAGIDLNVSGVTVIGHGNEANRPTITMSATASTFAMTAANVRLVNFRFILTADPTIVVDIDAAGCTVDLCDFPARTAATAREYVTAIDVNGGSANACDRTTISRCRFISTANAGSDRAIELGEVADSVKIEGCYIDGDWTDGGIHNPTGKVLTNLLLKDNVVRNRQTGDHAVELVSACTGEAVNNRLFGDTSGTIFDPGSLFCADNWESAAIDEPGVPSPLALPDVATNLLGVDDANNVGATTNVAANGDGTVLERLEELRDLVGNRPATFTLGGGLMVVKAAAALPASTTANIFTVTGLNEVVRLFGVVGTVIQAQACNLKVSSNPTAGTTADVAANLDINGDEAGTFYIVEGDGTALVGVDAGTGWGAAGLPHPWLVNTGAIEITTSATNTGTIAWYCIYRPLAASASIAAA